MSGRSDIEWTNYSWNPTRGCERISPGCKNCYAMRQAHRFSGPGGAYEGLTVLSPDGPVWAGKGLFLPRMLADPFKWTDSPVVFVNSMSDLFWEVFTDEQIAAVFGIMGATTSRYLILTKRAFRMRRWYDSMRDGTIQIPNLAFKPSVRTAAMVCMIAASRALTSVGLVDESAIVTEHMLDLVGNSQDWPAWPLPNVGVGVSTENEPLARRRIEELVNVPAAMRFASYEPALQDIRWDQILAPEHDGKRPCGTCAKCLTEDEGSCNGRESSINMIIVGGESGAKARSMQVDRIRSTVASCRRFGVFPFVKQFGADVRDRNDVGFLGNPDDAWDIKDLDRIEHSPDGVREEHQGALVRIRLRDRKGGDSAEWPADLRVREFPPGWMPNGFGGAKGDSAGNSDPEAAPVE